MRAIARWAIALAVLTGAAGPASALPGHGRPQAGLDDGAGEHGATAEAPAWRFRGAILAGALLAPREIGRDRNATGGEELIALLGDGFSLGFEAALETDAVGVEFALVGGSNRVDVENEFGVDFPNHGEAPWLWSWSAVLYPLVPLRATTFGQRFRPFAQVGIGGMLVSMDLDNVNDQSLYNSWQWVVGGGVRIFFDPGPAPDSGEPFVELRLMRHRLWMQGPLDAFDIWAAGLGIGMRT